MKSRVLVFARKRLIRMGVKRAVTWLALPLPARIAIWMGIPMATWGYRRYRKRRAGT